MSSSRSIGMASKENQSGRKQFRSVKMQGGGPNLPRRHRMRSCEEKLRLRTAAYLGTSVFGGSGFASGALTCLISCCAARLHGQMRAAAVAGALVKKRVALAVATGQQVLLCAIHCCCSMACHQHPPIARQAGLLSSSNGHALCRRALLLQPRPDVPHVAPQHR